MTLALLITAVTGTWAQDVTWNVSDISTAVDGNMGENEPYTSDGITMKFVKIEAGGSCTIGQNIEIWGGGGVLEFTAPDGMKFAKIVINGSGSKSFGYWNQVKYGNGEKDGVYSLTWEGEPAEVVTTSSTSDGWDLNVYNASTIEFTFENTLDLTWDAKTKTGYFTMPTYDVELTPVYAPAAQWALVETVKQLPTAAEGVIAGTDAPLIVEGIVAFAGTSTEVTQGVVMYAVTSTNQAKAPALTAFSATLPTAKDIADEGAEVLVWYYIKGADTPQGETATAENTFNDSEICETPITVTVLSNKFDIQFKAANANTIEAGKATVKVGETDAEVDENGKLTGVKMNSKVTITAKDGYKFRKVEGKKTGSAVLAPALENGATVVIICDWGDATTTFTYTNNGGTFSGQASGFEAGYFNNGLELNGKNLSFSAWDVDNSEFLSVGITFNTESSAYSYTGKGEDFSSFTISVNGTDVTDQLSELK